MGVVERFLQRVGSVFISGIVYILGALLSLNIVRIISQHLPPHPELFVYGLILFVLLLISVSLKLLLNISRKRTIIGVAIFGGLYIIALTVGTSYGYIPGGVTRFTYFAFILTGTIFVLGSVLGENIRPRLPYNVQLTTVFAEQDTTESTEDQAEQSSNETESEPKE